jgi:hypothetical protein
VCASTSKTYQGKQPTGSHGTLTIILLCGIPNWEEDTPGISLMTEGGLSDPHEGIYLCSTIVWSIGPFMSQASVFFFPLLGIQAPKRQVLASVGNGMNGGI